jgi:hypothetical protein
VGPLAKMRFLPKNFKENVFEKARILRLKILKNFNPMQRKFWFDEDQVFSRITEPSSKFLHPDENPGLSLKMSKEEKTNFVRSELNKLNKKMAPHIYLPTNPDTKILEILPDSAVTLQSAKKVPFIVSFVGVTYDGPDSDFLVTQMNFLDFINYEILAFHNALRHPDTQLAEANFTHLMINNKSTHHTLEDRVLSIDNIFNENKSNNLLMLDDEPFIYDDFEEMEKLSIPCIDIKIFNKKGENVSNLDKTIEKRDLSGVEDDKEFNNMNFHDLSSCTESETEEEKVLETTSKSYILNNIFTLNLHILDR